MSYTRRARRSTSIGTCALMLLGFSAGPIAAQSTLGQSFIASPSPATVLRRLTVGSTGIIGSSSGAPYTADIYAVSGTALVGASLFTQVLGTNVAGFSLFPNLALAAGGSYAVLVGGGTGPLTTYFDANPYPGGTAYTCSGINCSTFGANDLNGFFLDFGPGTNDPRNMLGQSFTAPSDPNVLLQQISVGSTGILGSSTGAPYSADIYALSGGLLTGGSLFSQMLGTSVAGFTLQPNLVLNAGGTYVVMVSGGNGSFYTNFDADTYTAGAAYTCFDGRDCASFGSNDLNGLQLRFGAPTTVPEPGTSALLGLGLLACSAVMVRARRRAIDA